MKQVAKKKGQWKMLLSIDAVKKSFPIQTAMCFVRRIKFSRGY